MNLQLTLAVRYLWGRKLRSVLTTAAVTLGALLIFAMNMMLPTMMKAFEANLLAASGQVDINVVHRTGEAFSEGVLNDLKSIPGIRVLAGSLSRTLNIPADYYSPAEIGALTLTGIDPKESQRLRVYAVESGRFLRPGDSSSAVIASSLAKQLGVGVGDEFHLPTPEGTVDLRVLGLLPERTLPGNEEVLVTLFEAQRLFDLPQRINTIEVNLDASDDATREAVQRSIEAKLGDDYTLGGLSSGSEMVASFRTGQVAFNILGFLALVMGGFIIFNTFRTIVAERRHDIGMLRALGASRRTVIGLVLTEGLVQGVVGTLAGMVLGYLGGGLLLAAMSPMLELYVHMDMGAPVVQPGLILVTLLLGIGVTLVSGLLPAWQASRVTPMEALRPGIVDEGHVRRRRGVVIGIALILLAGIALVTGNMGWIAIGGVCFLVGLVLVGPALVAPLTSAFGVLLERSIAQDGTGILARSNLNRQPSRSAITASATMVGLAVIVGVGGMIWSVTGGFMGVLERSLGSDYLFMPPSVGVWGSDVGAKEGLADSLRSVPGVGVVSSFRYAAATIDGKSLALLGIDPVAYPKVASLTFREGDAATAYQKLGEGRGIIINGLVGAQLGVGVGSQVDISSPAGHKTYTVVAVAGDYLNAKIMTGYISHASMERDFHKTEDIFLQVNLAPGADPAKVEPRMQRVLEDYPQFKLVSGEAYFDQNKSMFNAIFGIYFVLLGVLVAPSLLALLNTLAIGVIERTREIGMLRAIGAQRRQVRRMVLAESLLLAGIGTALGLLGGLYLGYVLVIGLRSGGFPVQYAFPYVGLVAAISTGLLFGVLAAVLPARQAAQLEIVNALRYE